MIMFPAFDAILTDRRVRPRAKGVYFHLVKRLAMYELRAVKVTSLGHELGIDRSDVARDLRDLTRIGYLIRNGRAYPRGPYRYQLATTLPSGGKPPTIGPRGR